MRVCINLYIAVSEKNSTQQYVRFNNSNKYSEYCMQIGQKKFR